jgi:hypothetical protein
MRYVFLAVLIALTLTLAGCEVIGGIFKAGFFVGVIVVMLVVVGVGFLVAKMRS